MPNPKPPLPPLSPTIFANLQDGETPIFYQYLDRISANVHNRKVLRSHASFVISDTRPVPTVGHKRWLCMDLNNNLLFEIFNPQDYSIFDLEKINKTVLFFNIESELFGKYRTQTSYLKDLLGDYHYERIFVQSVVHPNKK